MGQENPESVSVNGKNQHAFLVESAWEVCNQVGGIYTVIRSKLPVVMENWGDRYCLIGPYVNPNVTATFEETDDLSDPFGQAVLRMREMGLEVHYGRWLVSGRPRVVLVNPHSIYDRLGDIKYGLWERHNISTMNSEDLISQVVAFGEMVRIFLTELANEKEKHGREIITHFHEWMAATPIPDLRRDNIDLKIVFTTHATMLGRYLAMNDPGFYHHMPTFDWQKEAKNFNIETQVTIERAAAHGAHILTTVSDVTSTECEHLLGRKADAILPNGLNIKRFSAEHEIQILHQQYKDEINSFVIGHFFPSYTFDLDKTLYFFTSGRYEYKNKGFDLTLEALARLNWRLQQANIDITVVMFFITKKPFHSINPEVLHSRAVMEEIRKTCEIISNQVKDQLFEAAATNPEHRIPDLNSFVSDTWKLRLRRNLQSWQSNHLPSVITHNLIDNDKDEILNFIRMSNLINNQYDKIKIVYHPDFLSPTNPFFGIEYTEFVRGCHLGIFPSYYEPWGYTPLECLASGVPAVTSDLAGFGDYAGRNIANPDENGVYLVHRRDKSFEDAANELTDKMFDFVQQSRRARIAQRYTVEKTSLLFDWKNLYRHYQEAYSMALS